MAWLQQLRFDGDPASQAVFDSYMLAVEQGDERLLALENKIGEFGCQEPYREPVGWLRCFRGIDMVTAVSLVAELHDFRRFTTARQLMSYLGLVPRESSSGERERRGAITKAGNAHVRRSSSAGESHPHALTEPDVNLSTHPAPTAQPQDEFQAASEQTVPVDVVRRDRANVLPRAHAAGTAGTSGKPISREHC